MSKVLKEKCMDENVEGEIKEIMRKESKNK
jgi:hypothetical protein